MDQLDFSNDEVVFKNIIIPYSLLLIKDNEKIVNELFSSEDKMFDISNTIKINSTSLIDGMIRYKKLGTICVNTNTKLSWYKKLMLKLIFKLL